jgi:hypothetical protein
MVEAAMQKLLPIPEVSEAERTPLVEALLQVIAALQEKVHLQQEQIQAFRDEIAQLKGQKPRPKTKPSKLREPLEQKQNKDKGEGKRDGSSKRNKTKELEIHETKVIKPDGIPEGSEFKGYQNYTVQGLMMKAHNVVYRLERWKTPQGASVVGKLPSEAGDGHFDNTLITFILYQYYHCLVTQPLILEQLHELGIEISSGQISHIIISLPKARILIILRRTRYYGWGLRYRNTSMSTIPAHVIRVTMAIAPILATSYSPGFKVPRVKVA